jgi:pimeloyl-ACP methyl ester carboxylesterase
VSADRAVAWPALGRFVAGMAPELDSHWLLDGAMRSSAAARAGMFAREVDNADLLAAIDVPTLIVHGRRDRVVDPSAAEYAAGLIPDSTLTWLDAGHLPFVEDQAAFERAVAAHADHCLGRVA